MANYTKGCVYVADDNKLTIATDDDIAHYPSVRQAKAFAFVLIREQAIQETRNSITFISVKSRYLTERQQRVVSMLLMIIHILLLLIKVYPQKVHL